MIIGRCRRLRHQALHDNGCSLLRTTGILRRTSRACRSEQCRLEWGTYQGPHCKYTPAMYTRGAFCSWHVSDVQAGGAFLESLNLVRVEPCGFDGEIMATLQIMILYNQRKVDKACRKKW